MKRCKQLTRPHNDESDLKKTKDLLKNSQDDLTTCKGENGSMKEQLLEKSTEIVELRNKVSALEENVAKRFESVQKEMRFQNRPTVCFSAKIEPSNHDIAPGSNAIVFRGVHTNIGNGYNPGNGEFTTPVAGQYVFYSNMYPQGGRSGETVLQVNGVSKQSVYADHRSYQGGSMMVVHLNVGEKVWVARQGPWVTHNLYCVYSESSFSGFLLQADN